MPPPPQPPRYARDRRGGRTKREHRGRLGAVNTVEDWRVVHTVGQGTGVGPVSYCAQEAHPCAVGPSSPILMKDGTISKRVSGRSLLKKRVGFTALAFCRCPLGCGNHKVIF